MNMSNFNVPGGDHHRLARGTDHRLARRQRGAGLLLGLIMLGGCEAGQLPAPGSPAATTADAIPAPTRSEESRMWMTIGERRFAITLADNETARAFASRLPLTLDMAELNGNEKHADLTQPLPTNASPPGTIHNGDLMLYGSDTVVVYYRTFDSSYSYTRLGRVDAPAALAQVLGGGGARVVFSSD